MERQGLLTRTESREKMQAVRAEPESESILFSTVRSALRFAYQMEGAIICKSQNFNPQQGGNAGPLSGLTLHERIAQAVFIRQAVENRLERRELYMVWAFFTEDGRRDVGQNEVSHEVAFMVRRRGLGVELAKRHFNEGRAGCKTLAKLSQQFNVPERTVERLAAAIGAEITRNLYAAEERLHNLFVSTGVCARVR